MANLIMPLQIERQYSGSLDANFSFDTLEELKNYATTSALSYSGQILYCKGTDTIYKVNSDKTDVTELGGTESDIIVAHTPDEADALQTKENRNKIMFYMGNSDSSYIKGEMYYLHWNAITLKKFYIKGGGILEIDYDVLEKKYASYSQTITFKAEYKQDTTNVMNRWFCEYSGGSGSRLDVVGVNISNGSETLGDVIEFTYNSASKNSDNYTWKPLFIKPQRTFGENWWLVNKIATYGGGYDDEFINGHRYQFTTDININATASGNIVVSLDEEQYKNYFGLHSKSSFIYNANTGCFEYRYGMIHYEDNRFTIEYLNKAGITWTGEIANGDTITVTCTMSDDINDYYWKDLDAEGGGYTQLSQAEYDALTDDEKMNGKEYRTYDTGHIYRLGVEYGKDADISRSEVLRTYTTISDLNTRKGTSVTLVAGEDNTIAIIEALDAKEQFIEWFNNGGASTDRFGIDNTKYGKRINELKIVKMTSTDASAIAVMDSGVVLSRVYTNSTLGEWCVKKENTTGLISNAQSFKIDLTKNNPSWYGFFTFSFSYGATPCEITVSITTDVYYTITKGQNVVSAITYTQDGANYTFGIDFTTKIYGTQVVEIPTEFGVVNSFTAETYAGDTTAICKGAYSMKSYSALSELGLDTTATINDIIGAMADGSVFTYKTDVFDYATEYNNIQYGTVTIHKQSASRLQVLMTDKDTGNLYVGKSNATNQIVGWRNESFHRVVAQATAGYFKFKPTSDGGFDQSLRISATDNYGGMIEISGSSPSQDQYKPFKCVRLSNGTYASYDAANTTNNKMKKLYLYDGYMYLQVETYTTVTFTGLIEAPTFVETLADTSTEIPIVSLVNPSIKAAAGSNINSVGTPSVTASESNGTTTFTFNYLKGAKGDTGATGTTPTIKAAAGSNINTVGTPSVTASTSGTTTTFTFNNLKGAKGDTGSNGTTPTIKVANGSNINSVGTPTVSASTSGTTTTFTFDYLKGATGASGYKRFPSTPGVTTTTGTICSLESKKIVVLYCISSGGGSLKLTSYPSSGVTFNGSAWTSGTKPISIGSIYTIANTSSSTTTVQIENNGGGGFLIFGPMS